MGSNINFAIQVSSYDDDCVRGFRLLDGREVSVKMAASTGSGFDRRRSISSIQESGPNEVKVGGIISVERWHQEGDDADCFMAGYIHRLTGSCESLEERTLHNVMAKPCAPYGGASHSPRAYVDILKPASGVSMDRARSIIIRSYLANDYSLGNPFVLVRDAKQQQKCFQLPVCHKVKDEEGVYVPPSESDILKSLHSDPYKKFKRLLDRLDGRSEQVEVVPGFRAQVSGALAQDPRYISLQEKIYSSKDQGGSTVANYRNSLVSFKKHKTPGSEDYYMAYLCPSLMDSGALNLAGCSP